MADFDRTIALEPGDAIPYYNRGCAYAGMGDLCGALEDFDRSIDLDPATANPCFAGALPI